jgi:sulfofructose kinase
MPEFFACVGHAAVDHHFEIEAFSATPTKTPAHDYRQIVGGMAANAAISLARLGPRVRLFGRVGDDEAGRFIQAQIQAQGIGNELLAVAGAGTSVSSVIVDARGERQIFNHRGDALRQAPALDTQRLQGALAVLVDPRWGDGAAAALIWAREHKLLSMLDADVAPAQVLQKLVPLAQWVVFSEPGLRCFAPQAASRQDALTLALQAGAERAMVTLGEQGVVWMHAGASEVFKQTAFPVQALDTTGAGDVFHAALLFALSELPPLADASKERQAVRFACAAAALKCTRRYGALGAPTRAEVLSFMEQQAAKFGSA